MSGSTRVAPTLLDEPILFLHSRGRPKSAQQLRALFVLGDIPNATVATGAYTVQVLRRLAQAGLLVALAGALIANSELLASNNLLPRRVAFHLAALLAMLLAASRPRRLESDGALVALLGWSLCAWALSDVRAAGATGMLDAAAALALVFALGASCDSAAAGNEDPSCGRVNVRIDLSNIETNNRRWRNGWEDYSFMDPAAVLGHEFIHGYDYLFGWPPTAPSEGGPEYIEQLIQQRLNP